MKNYEYVIGIDPDVDKSGFAVYLRSNNRLTLHQYDLFDLFEQILKFTRPTLIRLEAGHHVKSTWHKGGNAMARRVGRNHQVGFEIEKFCTRFKIPFELVKPCGLSQINHEKFCKITGWDIKKLTNPEKRVAGLLAFSKHKHDYAAW